MRQLLYSFFCILFSLVLCNNELKAQQTATARVVDSETGEPIPFATVYVSESKGALTNEEGMFSIDLEKGEAVRVSFMGYGKQLFSAGDVPKTIELEPAATQLREFTMVAPNSILKNIIKSLNAEYKVREGKTANFFLRQTFEQENGRNEMVEGFMNSASAINLRKTSILNARHYCIGEHSEVRNIFAASNLQHLFDFAPRVYDTSFWKDVHVPLGFCKNSGASSALIGRGGIMSGSGLQFYDHYEAAASNYNTYIEEYTEEGEDFFKISFTRKESKYNSGLVTGILYVKAKGYKLMGFEGQMSNVVLDTEKDFWTQANQTEPVIRIGYTHRRGFTEVEYVACTLEAAGMKCRSIAYNLGKRKIKTAKGKKVKLEDNLLDAIDRAGYDSTLWQQTCIQRTEEEERIVRESMTSGDTAAIEIAREAEAPAYRPDSLAAASGSFRPLVERLRAFGRTIPQEKVYVHMDNTCYQLGDTIWFTAYTRRTDTGRPSDVSGLLYVELYGQEGYLVERKLVQMHDGQGEGFFALDHLIQYAGLYELRAYTRWQLNWGGYDRKHSPWAFTWFESKEQERAYFRDYAKLYSRVFPVYDRPKEPGEFTRDVTLRGKRRYFRRDRDKHELTLTLFPEGGALVTGLPCRMAFEAAWDDGQWVDGWLHYGQDSARVVNRGRGTITLTPSGKKKQKVTFVTADGKKAQAYLPQADTMGVALRMEQTGGGWTARIATSPNLPARNLALTLMHEGRTMAFSRLETLKAGADGWQFEISDSLLDGSGVYQLTVFDRRGYVYADRLFFARNGSDMEPTLAILGLKPEYAPYEPVSLRVKARQAGGSVSLTVRDDNMRDFLYDNGSILTEMLLASEIRGFVPNPGWYFERDDEERRTALDLLMMTQGWRRFRWQDMAVRGAWELSQPAEQAPILRGRVYKKNASYNYNVRNLMSPSLSSMFHRDAESSKPAKPSLTGIPKEYRQEETPEDDAEKAYKEHEKKTWRQDRQDMFTQMYQKSKHDVKVHSELVSDDGTKIAINERTTRNGRFQIQLPPFYGQAVFFLSAADTTKWSKRKRRKYQWIQGAEYKEGYDGRAPENKIKKARFDIQPADYLSRVQWPYPRFVAPYTHYQSRLAQRPEKEDSILPFALDADSAYNMREVSVHARHNGMRGFDDSMPCLIIDAEEAFNLTFDAGMYNFARYLVADYGMDYPYVQAPIWRERTQRKLEENTQYANIEMRYGISPMRRSLPPYRDMFEGVPEDSLYARKYLVSFSMIHSKEEEREYNRGIDKELLYTDYNRRLPGNWRYRGTDLPVTTLVSYPYADQSERMYYRDRHYTLQGFAYPAEFYSPDYSRRELTDKPNDYRRTLYWNPHIKLDSNGEAEVKFYNCSRQTEPSADAQGQSEDGTLLWNGDF